MAAQLAGNLNIQQEVQGFAVPTNQQQEDLDAKQDCVAPHLRVEFALERQFNKFFSAKKVKKWASDIAHKHSPHAVTALFRANDRLTDEQYETMTDTLHLFIIGDYEDKNNKQSTAIPYASLWDLFHESFREAIKTLPPGGNYNTRVRDALIVEVPELILRKWELKQGLADQQKKFDGMLAKQQAVFDKQAANLKRGNDAGSTDAPNKRIKTGDEGAVSTDSPKKQRACEGWLLSKKTGVPCPGHGPMHTAGTVHKIAPSLLSYLNRQNKWDLTEQQMKELLQEMDP
jgi:hypothetical protein